MVERRSPLTEPVRFRATAPIKRGIETAAARAGQSASSWIRDLVVERLVALGLLDGPGSNAHSAEPAGHDVAIHDGPRGLVTA